MCVCPMGWLLLKEKGSRCTCVRSPTTNVHKICSRKGGGWRRGGGGEGDQEGPDPRPP